MRFVFAYGARDRHGYWDRSSCRSSWLGQTASQPPGPIVIRICKSEVVQNHPCTGVVGVLACPPPTLTPHTTHGPSPPTPRSTCSDSTVLACRSTTSLYPKLDGPPVRSLPRLSDLDVVGTEFSKNAENQYPGIKTLVTVQRFTWKVPPGVRHRKRELDFTAVGALSKQ